MYIIYSKHSKKERNQTDKKEYRKPQNGSVPNCSEGFYSNRLSRESRRGSKFLQLDSLIRKQVVTHQTLQDLQ